LSKGLEAHIGSSVEIAISQRIDAEYFKKAYAQAEKLVRTNTNNLPLKELHATIRRGTQPEYADHGVPVVNSQHVKAMFVAVSNENRLAAAPQNDWLISKGDVLVNGTGLGTIGRVSLYVGENQAIPDNHVTIVRTTEIEPEYLAAFLNSSFGQSQLQRRVRGSSGQVELYPRDISDVTIWNASDQLRRQIQQTYQRSFDERENSERLHHISDQLILTSLGLDDWTPPEPLNYTASSNDAFAAGRIDAQYFRPLFTEIEERLLATGNARTLGSLLDINARGRQPVYSNNGLPVVNSKHVRTNRVVIDADNRQAIERGSPVIIKKGDVLINGTGVGTIGRAAAYLHDQKALPDNHVTVLRTKAIHPVYLAAFLNSPLGQWQVERHIKGSSGQIELYPSDIARIVVWDAPANIQHEARDAIHSAFDSERKAIELLESARRAVEIAIEDGEPAAGAYLDKFEEAN